MLPCLCVGLASVCYGFWLSPACQSLVYPLRSSRSPLPTETTGNHYLKSTNPSLFPSHKGAMCTFSILPANSRVCVCVCFRNASAVFSLTSWFISSFPNFFFPFLHFSVFLFLLCFPLTAAWVQTELKKEVRLQHVPDLPMDHLSSLSVFHYVSVALFVSPSANHTQLPTQARFYAGYELQGRS